MECWLHFGWAMLGTIPSFFYLNIFFFSSVEFSVGSVYIWNCPLVNYLLQGEALFQTHENLEHLAMMERVLGPFPQHMLKKAEYV